jgi:hypothetical protein
VAFASDRLDMNSIILFTSIVSLGLWCAHFRVKQSFFVITALVDSTERAIFARL